MCILETFGAALLWRVSVAAVEGNGMIFAVLLVSVHLFNKINKFAVRILLSWLYRT